MSESLTPNLTSPPPAPGIAPRIVPRTDRQAERGRLGSVPEDHTGREDTLWLPARRIRRYQWYKALGGLLMAGVFAGWLVIQWSNPAMRVVCGGLLVVTTWVVAASIIEDWRRGQGRQVCIERGKMRVTVPDGVTEFSIKHVAQVVWDDGPDGGLHFCDKDRRTLATLDAQFVADRCEARAFLAWARQRADMRFQARWPRETTRLA